MGVEGTLQRPPEGAAAPGPWGAGLFPVSTKGFLVHGELPTPTAF